MAENIGASVDDGASGVELLESFTAAGESAIAAISGHLAGVDDEGRLIFRPDGATDEFPVAIGVALTDDELVRAAWLGQRALVIRSSNEPSQFVLVSLPRERVAAAAKDALRNGINVKVDGEDVHLTGRNEIELRCGKARIVLHKCGKIEMSGTNIISRSRGPVKIKGATIALN